MEVKHRWLCESSGSQQAEIKLWRHTVQSRCVSNHVVRFKFYPNFSSIFKTVSKFIELTKIVTTSHNITKIKFLII